MGADIMRVVGSKSEKFRSVSRKKNQAQMKNSQANPPLGCQELFMGD